MAVKAKTVKRVTKVLVLDERSFQFHGRYKGDEPWEGNGTLNTDLNLYLPDFDRLGRPKKVRVTITALED